MISKFKNIIFFLLLSSLEFLFLSLIISFTFKVSIYKLIYSPEINNLPKIIHFSLIYIFLIINIFFLEKEKFKIKTKINFKYLIKGFLYSLVFLLIYFVLNNFNIKNNLDYYILIQCFVLSIFIGYIEEIIFRFFLYENLKFIGSFSKIIVSYIYSQLHFSNFDLLGVISLFIFGLILIEIYQINFYLTVGVHSGIVFILSYIDIIRPFENYVKPQNSFIGFFLLVFWYLLVKKKLRQLDSNQRPIG